MLQTGLEFAPGTTDECKKLITQLFTPNDIFGAYRAACIQLGSRDIVLRVSEQDPSGFEAESRVKYIKRVQDFSRGTVPLLMRRMAAESAQKVMNLPADSDAVWLVLVRGMKTVPITCVIFATPYEVAAAN
jgi:hypothetical protein